MLLSASALVALAANAVACPEAEHAVYNGTPIEVLADDPMAGVSKPVLISDVMVITVEGDNEVIGRVLLWTIREAFAPTRD